MQIILRLLWGFFPFSRTISRGPLGLLKYLKFFSSSSKGELTACRLLIQPYISRETESIANEATLTSKAFINAFTIDIKQN